MSKYKCDVCESIIDEDDIEYVRETYESYYGVTDLPGRHYFYMPICPFSTAAFSSGVISMECWVDCAELSFFIE